jgi:tetratricopeptide (TPR) repeat protein
MLRQQFSCSGFPAPLIECRPGAWANFVGRFDSRLAFMGRLRAISRQLRSARNISRGLGVFILFTWLPLSMQSQQSATLRGTVRDLHGNPVAGATVQLHSKETAQIQTVPTDSQGNYGFVGLRGGVYGLRAAMVGYSDAEIPSLFLGPQETKTVDLALQPARTPVSSLAQKPAFFDQPQFTVAGVTDTTSLGGHGSDTIVRTRETLAKETVSLGKDSLGTAPVGGYERQRDSIQASLAHRDTAALHHALGDVQEKLGNSLEAVREYQRAAELDPSESYVFAWGSELLLHHAPEPAQDVFTQGAHLFPRSVRMLLGLGASWFARGSYDQALRQIFAASDLNPNDPTPYLFLGKMQSVETAPSQEAVEKLHGFVTHHPENSEANYYYAVGLWKLGEAQQDTARAAHVEALLRNAIRVDPKYAAAYLQLGILHSEQKNYPQAISDYQHAVQADPDMDEAHYRLAQTYRRIGDTAKAEAELHLYDTVAKESAQREDRERHEIRQFVYTLRDPPPAQVP